MICLEDYGRTSLRVIAYTEVGGARFIMSEAGPLVMHRHGPVCRTPWGRFRWTPEDAKARGLNLEEIVAMKQLCAEMDPHGADARKFIKASWRL